MDNFLKIGSFGAIQGKFSAVLEKNPNLKTIKNLNSVLKGKSLEMNGMAHGLFYKF